MSKTKVEGNPEPEGKLDKTKQYVKDNWKPIAIGAGATVVTIGVIIVAKRVIFPNQSAMLIKKMIVKDSVFLIQTYERHQGPPSWMVRVDDGRLFRSQDAAAKALKTDPSTISRYFAGLRNHVNGHQLERVAIEVGR